jgi:diaminopimelate epimerase
VNFEKWQALGNDYLILEAEQLGFELTPARIRALCAPHTGIFADGILLLSAPDERGFVARLRIFNPDGSEAELSGNGAREAVLYLPSRRQLARSARRSPRRRPLASTSAECAHRAPISPTVRPTDDPR